MFNIIKYKLNYKQKFHGNGGVNKKKIKINANDTFWTKSNKIAKLAKSKQKYT